MKTIKVKAWAEGQGDFVIINEEDFDAEKHEKFEEEKPRRGRKPKAAQED